MQLPLSIRITSPSLFRVILREYVFCKQERFFWSVSLLSFDLQNFLHEAGGMAGEW
ncbi:hypothetical protein [Solimicrobium silvestre]|uniref:Uncharacterized protein n=1 Tax=Solimicrobium silvestre TaxID=2099400 RepID=A0A2S9GTE7_9BURK|nr:hypothetical protein [Solimicrobium silvestre]PRC90994.1 hypothetical protein S2091_4290 [Solimicrobium silvestre]